MAVVDRLLADSDPHVRAVAAACGWETRPALLPAIADAPDELAYLWRKALANAHFQPDTLAALRHRGFAFLYQLAENPHLPLEMVEELARDSHPAVRLAVSMRYGLPDRTRRAIDYQVLPGDRIMPALWAATTEDTAQMRWAAESDHVGLRRSIAGNPRLPGELVDRLASDVDFAVRLLLCENHPDAPADLLWSTFFEAMVITRWDLLKHKNFPTHRLGALASSDEPEDRSLVADDPTAPAELIDHLSRDPDPRVRRSTAADPRLDRHRVLELLDDDTAVAAEASRNPNLPPETMAAILTAAGIPL